jgi:DNA polymerase-3 subunit gamma/tau
MKDLEDLKKEKIALPGKHLTKSTAPSPSRTEEKVDSKNFPPKVNENLSTPIGEEKGKREREVEMALKDPSVKSFMDTFKARVLSVKPVERTEKKE